jgi:hypothetical protein
MNKPFLLDGSATNKGAGKRGDKMFKANKFIVRISLLSIVMMASGCALGVNEVPIDNNEGHSVALENAVDRHGGAPGNGTTPGGGQGGGDNGGGGSTTSGNPGSEDGNGGKHPNSGGGNSKEIGADGLDMDPGKGNQNRGIRSKGKNQGSD